MFAEVVATPKNTPMYRVVAAVAKAILVDLCSVTKCKKRGGGGLLHAHTHDAYQAVEDDERAAEAVLVADPGHGEHPLKSSQRALSIVHGEEK